MTEVYTEKIRKRLEQLNYEKFFSAVKEQCKYNKKQGDAVGIARKPTAPSCSLFY